MLAALAIALHWGAVILKALFRRQRESPRAAEGPRHQKCYQCATISAVARINSTTL